MARYSGLYTRKKKQSKKDIYIISALAIVIGLGAYFLISRLGGQDEAPAPDVGVSPVEVAAPQETIPPEVAVPEVLPPEPAPEPAPELPKVPLETVTEPNSEASKLIAEAMQLINTSPDRIIEARDVLNDVLLMPMSGFQRKFVKERLSEISEKWLFSRSIYPGDTLCSSYKVKGGDLLSKIGKKFKVPWEILLEINNISAPESLRAGETIKVINGPFHAKIYRSTFTMDVYLQKTFVRSFIVGLGKPGRETPTGLWVVQVGGKMEKPTWTDPDTQITYEPENPDYPLGSRWIALKGLKGNAVGRTGIAIHGTKEPEQLGTQGSRGCIRLHNGNVILVYNLLEPGLSHVEVVD